VVSTEGASLSSSERTHVSESAQTMELLKRDQSKIGDTTASSPHDLVGGVAEDVA
jgi:hypothetical protein